MDHVVCAELAWATARAGRPGAPVQLPRRGSEPGAAGRRRGPGRGRRGGAPAPPGEHRAGRCRGGRRGRLGRCCRPPGDRASRRRRPRPRQPTAAASCSGGSTSRCCASSGRTSPGAQGSWPARPRRAGGWRWSPGRTRASSATSPRSEGWRSAGSSGPASPWNREESRGAPIGCGRRTYDSHIEPCSLGALEESDAVWLVSRRRSLARGSVRAVARAHQGHAARVRPRLRGAPRPGHRLPRRHSGRGGRRARAPLGTSAPLQLGRGHPLRHRHRRRGRRRGRGARPCPGRRRRGGGRATGPGGGAGLHPQRPRVRQAVEPPDDPHARGLGHLAREGRDGGGHRHRHRLRGPGRLRAGPGPGRRPLRRGVRLRQRHHPPQRRERPRHARRRHHRPAHQQWCRRRRRGVRGAADAAEGAGSVGHRELGRHRRRHPLGGGPRGQGAEPLARRPGVLGSDGARRGVCPEQGRGGGLRGGELGPGPGLVPGRVRRRGRRGRRRPRRAARAILVLRRGARHRGSGRQHPARSGERHPPGHRRPVGFPEARARRVPGHVDGHAPRGRRGGAPLRRRGQVARRGGAGALRRRRVRGRLDAARGPRPAGCARSPERARKDRPRRGLDAARLERRAPGAAPPLAADEGASGLPQRPA